ncbi:MAG: MarR family transcriptional regulator [Lentisphaeria bacterium]|nr:MarR family transcriptional regulator [Lentisphaeria bacterium]
MGLQIVRICVILNHLFSFIRDDLTDMRDRNNEPAYTDIGGMICDAADELRDIWWSCKLPEEVKREIMKLTVSQQRMLRMVWRLTRDSSRGIMLRELADKFGLTSSAVSVMVESLVKIKCLERTVDPDDRRKVMIKISADGMKQCRIAEESFSEKIAEFVETYDADKLAAFKGVLTDFTKFLILKKGDC